MQLLYRNRKKILNVVRVFLALLATHILLWYGEPEGFFEIMAEEGFATQFIINAVALLFLFWITNLMLRHGRSRISQFRTDKKLWAMFLLKGLLVPVLLSILFGALYYTFHDVAFSLANYMKVVLPIVIGALLVVLGLECCLLAVEGINVLSRALQISKNIKMNIQRTGHRINLSTGDIVATEKEIQRKRLTTAKIVKAYRNKREYDMALQDFPLFDIVRGRVKGYDVEGNDYNFEFRALSQAKEWLSDDLLFFTTGSWIVRYDLIDRVENGEKRTLVIHLKGPFSFLQLNKSRAKEFLDWYEGRYTPTFE
ncbi:hypothetical protein [Sphingobacterium haloxyli]|uniref:HTH LytTR-type domain-containing protein n=1 Tax=Sphingobacterium haloxyli TaxID=2100533 RepID=A0A2S9IWU0_9SPHI|nr:hypothetical protein [Sphingobacterium haloxyli]PRD44985.1 hypothetical protein C5745_18970 [Sphingobacterium haloxyli]